MTFEAGPAQHRREGPLRRTFPRPDRSTPPGGPDGRPGPEPGDRRALQPPERRPVPRARADPQPRDVEPVARLRRAGRRASSTTTGRERAASLWAVVKAILLDPEARDAADRPDLRQAARSRPCTCSTSCAPSTRCRPTAARSPTAPSRRARTARATGPGDLQAADGLQLLPAGLPRAAGLGRSPRARVRHHGLVDVAEARQLRQHDDVRGRRRGRTATTTRLRHLDRLRPSSSSSRRTPTTSSTGSTGCSCTAPCPTSCAPRSSRPSTRFAVDRPVETRADQALYLVASSSQYQVQR